MSYETGPDRQQGWQGGQQYPGYGQQPPPGQGGWGAQPPMGGPAPMSGPNPMGGPSQPGGPPPMGAPMGAAAPRSGFSALLDFSFTTFATPSMIKLLYLVGSALILLSYLFYVIAAFAGVDVVTGLITLVIGAVVSVFMIALLRVSLEFSFAVVRMSEDIHNRRG